MKSRLLFVVAFATSCSRAPADSGVRGVWERVGFAPRSERALVRTTEPAAGRHDDSQGIHGYCPPQAEIFALSDGRRLVLRDPCSGPTELALRDTAGSEIPIPVDEPLYGAGRSKRGFALDAGYALVEMRLGDSPPNLLVVDLGSPKARYLRIPSSLEQSTGVELRVADGRIYLRGGQQLVVVGSGGCENPPPGIGCDPYVITSPTPNGDIWVLRPLP